MFVPWFNIIEMGGMIMGWFIIFERYRFNFCALNFDISLECWNVRGSPMDRGKWVGVNSVIPKLAWTWEQIDVVMGSVECTSILGLLKSLIVHMCVYLVIYIHIFYIYLFTHTCVYTSFLLPFAAARVGRLSPYELAKSDFYPAPSCQRKIWMAMVKKRARYGW